jgi:integral membrane protein (TIGR01906 family)
MERKMNRWIQVLLQIVIVVAVPIVLVVMPVRLLMHPRYVWLEYGKPDFAPDPLGFTREERTRLAIIGVESIVGPRGVVVLQEARLPDGSPAFNQREVDHMQDVRVVTANIYVAQVVMLIAAALAAFALVRAGPKSAAPTAMLTGASGTLVLLVALVALVLVGFDTFFTAFHRVFFTGETWLFDFTDTLIRLYPPQFWFDAATVIGVTTIVEAVVLGIAAWWWGRSVH